MPAEERKLFNWLTMERAGSIIVLIFAAGMTFNTFQSHDNRLNKLEDRDEKREHVLSEVRGDIKVLLERTHPNRLDIRKP